MRGYLIASIVLVAAASHAADPVTVIRFGKLIDGKGNVINNPSIVVRGERVERIATASEPLPPGATVIDLQKLTAIPGLIDAHTHMTFYWDRTPGTKPWTQLGTLGAPVTVFLAQENARKTLQSGVTTVRDLGSWEYTDIAMRDLINRGAMTGPRMFVAGYGLHISSAPPKPGTTPDPGTCDGVAEVERVARQQIGAGVDWIKMYGSTGSDQDVTGFQTFSFDEMKAAADVAHRAGKRIAIHSYGPDGARDAVRAGADSIEHATDMDDATIAEMVRRKTFYVPTIDHNRYYVENRRQFGYSEEVAGRMNAYIERNLEAAR